MRSTVAAVVVTPQGEPISAQSLAPSRALMAQLTSLNVGFNDIGAAGVSLSSLALGGAHPCHICAEIGAQRCHVCAGTGPVIWIAEQYVPVSSRGNSQYGTGCVRHESGGAPMLHVIYSM